MYNTTGADNMSTIYTVNSKALSAHADSIERDANNSLTAWILLGQSERYSVAMADVRALRAAAAARSVWVRRETLRNSGFVVKSPRAARALGII
jgi:hypothetical protein